MVAGRRRCVTARADRLDPAGGLVAEQERELVVDPALAVVQVGVADAAGLDLHHDLARDRGRGSTTSTISTGAPLLLATTARTVCGTGAPRVRGGRLRVGGRYRTTSRRAPSSRRVQPRASVSSSSGTATRRVVPSACRACAERERLRQPGEHPHRPGRRVGQQRRPAPTRSSRPAVSAAASSRGPSPSASRSSCSGASKGAAASRASSAATPGGDRGHRAGPAHPPAGRLEPGGGDERRQQPQVGQADGPPGRLGGQPGLERGAAGEGVDGGDERRDPAVPGGAGRPASRPRPARPPSSPLDAERGEVGAQHRAAAGDLLREVGHAAGEVAPSARRRRPGGAGRAGRRRARARRRPRLQPGVAQQGPLAGAQRQRPGELQPHDVAAERAQPHRHGGAADVQHQLAGEPLDGRQPGVDRRRRAASCRAW